MNFKLLDAQEEIDRRNLELRLKDAKFELTALDSSWPKLGDTDQRCRCPKHNQATTNLFYSCFMRIRAAHNGERLVPAAELVGNLREVTDAKP